jgi:hypothetical protein
MAHPWHTHGKKWQSCTMSDNSKLLIELLLRALGCARSFEISDCDSGCRGFESHQPPIESSLERTLT